MGPPGPTGPKGDPGMAGPAGRDGSFSKSSGDGILYGIGIPPKSLGVNGNFYLSKPDMTLWQKEKGVWKVIVELNRSNVGIQGKPGTKIFTGTAAPTSAVPAKSRIGDYYLQTTTGKLSVKASGGSWTLVNTLGLIKDWNTISALDIDWSLQGPFKKTLNSSSTYTFSNTASGQTIVVKFTNTASNFTVTWPAGVVWSGGSAPTQTTGAKSDVYTFICDGSTFYGSFVQNF
jgi:hypothetical protein